MATAKTTAKTASKSAAKTAATPVSVDDHLAARATPAQRPDCDALVALMQGITGEAPRMWGPSIVGFGRYAYRYDSGRTGESCITGFAVRGKELVLYLMADGPRQADLLGRLGPHRSGQSCLYLKRLADVDVAVLQTLVTESVAELRRRYPGTAG